MKNLWSERDVAGMSNIDELVYQSRIVGSESSLVLWGGGNSSLKTIENDFMGREQLVLRVKGSGTDMKSITKDGFSGVLLESVVALLDRDDMSDEDMVDYLNHCLVEPGAPRPSIETLLHAFIPQRSVLHTHADAILSITNTSMSESLLYEAFGGSVAVIAYHRPGFLLSKEVYNKLANNTEATAIVLLNHGLVTWGDTPKTAYGNHIDFVSTAEEFIESKRVGRKIIQAPKVLDISLNERRSIAKHLSPVIRGQVSARKRVVLRFEDGEEVMNFVNSQEAGNLVQVGAATPDHLLNTKRFPLIIDLADPGNIVVLEQSVRKGISEYAKSYEHWFSMNSDGEQEMLDPFPRVILIKGIGMWTTGSSAMSAIIAADIYKHTINIMTAAHSIDHYVSLSTEEAFRAEYWPLELYKRTLAPKEKELSGRVAMITGAASGIGRAIAFRFAEEGAHVVVTDLDTERAKLVADEIASTIGDHRATYCGLDVSDEPSVLAAYELARVTFGGLDIIVSNAGVAYTGRMDSLTLSDWQNSLAVNATGHFLVSREAVRLLKQQNLGGSIVFIATKNVAEPGQDLGAYSAAKAAEAQIARVVAIENGKFGIRSNMINPDAIFQDSGLWTQQIRTERAKAHGITADSIEEFYRDRSLLKTSVYAEDVAETALFLAADRSSKTTGAMIQVDAGIRGAFPR